ncbi:hypothetical protein [Nocardia arthritidis]|uniref:hypothetical protein n=1 Tax=Nocardia arthritidis TaxID=228602 RepID=UPI001C3F9A6C|nr:hypothetical protein [Nocardia arthritidis]
MPAGATTCSPILSSSTPSPTAMISPATRPQYTVLLTLSREDAMSGAQLARACGVTQQSMATKS